VEETHADTGRTCKLHTDSHPRLELRGSSVCHCAAHGGLEKIGVVEIELGGGRDMQNGVRGWGKQCCISAHGDIDVEGW